ncbi:MAG: polysaccharide biosynthesis protein [archaeon]|nr:polysaccharide biosynthesis protein [archaeon]
MDAEKFFKDKDILVTGGCGSVGSEIVKQLLEYDVKRVRVLDNSEVAQFNLLQRMKNNPKLRALIGDIRDLQRVKRAMKGVDIVFHAAALKHVPLCEYNPFEAVSTNVYGTQNLVNIAGEEGVEKFISISTDKAVNPINTMGATKLLSEKIVLNASIGDVDTQFSCVRFGNVLNSSGSVIPIFEEQIKKGGPVTLTSKEMVRFFMSLPNAVELILKAAQEMTSREIFILKMNAMKIIDLAEIMIEEVAPKYGYNPKDIKIEIIGKRPGEKISELLMTTEEAEYAVEKDNLFIIKEQPISMYAAGKKQSPIQPLSKQYDANSAKLLNREEIRELFKNNKNQD